MLVPVINGLSSHIGGDSGSKLIIQGSGFSVNPQNMSVLVSGVECKIVSSTLFEIQCIVVPNYGENTFGKIVTS